MNKKENWLAVYKGEEAERIPYSWEPFTGEIFTIFYVDPQAEMDLGVQPDGKECPDSWGTVWCFKPGAPGPHPHVTPENAVIKDITQWREQIKMPDVRSLDWSRVAAKVSEVDRSEHMVMAGCFGGLFERTHYLMGMENALASYMTEPDEMKELVAAIADFKIAHIDEIYKAMKPDVLHYHDDWGTKVNVFLPPDIWRDIIKPQHKRIVDAAHERGMIFMHHADCICRQYVEDMIEMGIDIWQGVIPQNDIVELQKVINGRMCLMGGIDGPTVDNPEASEEEIRNEVRRVIDTYCPQGRFLPCIPNLIPFNPHTLDILKDEMIKYGAEFYKR